MLALRKRSVHANVTQPGEKRHDFFSLFRRRGSSFGIATCRTQTGRLEVFEHTPLAAIQKWSLDALRQRNELAVPSGASITSRRLVRILFTDLIQSYQAWRHMWGLPVNGQRTWSNSWTAYRANRFMRDNKLRIAKVYYGRDYRGDRRIGFWSEHRNRLWLRQ